MIVMSVEVAQRRAGGADHHAIRFTVSTKWLGADSLLTLFLRIGSVYDGDCCA